MTTITRFTKEQLLKRLEEQMSSARYALGFVQDSEILRDIEMDLRITEIALASLEAEPIGITGRSEIECLKRGEMANVMPPDYKGVDAGDEVYVYVVPTATVEPVAFINGAWTLVYYRPPKELGLKIGDKLYAASPAPVPMKEHQIRELVNELRDIAVKYHSTQQLRERIARTVRAAMLQGSQPVSNCDELSSPVIPDGYVLVPKEPTEAMLLLLGLTGSFTAMDAAYQKMLAASPLHSATSTDI
ncbi:hypothetical protein V7I44_26455 [Citrobacter farmeri]|uniref:hypothetical protein n=1 Tax=Citrobacter farmeri TaxID=67824 RepID=UPI002FEFF620